MRAPVCAASLAAAVQRRPGMMAGQVKKCIPRLIPPKLKQLAAAAVGALQTWSMMNAAAALLAAVLAGTAAAQGTGPTFAGFANKTACKVS